MNAISNEKRPTSMAFYIRPTGKQICRGFKAHDLIMCKSKVQNVVSLGRHWVLTNGTWQALLQSGNVFELGGITTFFNPDDGKQPKTFGSNILILILNPVNGPMILHKWPKNYWHKSYLIWWERNEKKMKQKDTVHFNKTSLQKLDTLHVKNIQLIILICLHTWYHLFAKINFSNYSSFQWAWENTHASHFSWLYITYKSVE